MAESFYRNLVAKTKQWYLAESQELKVEVAGKKLEAFMIQTCSDLGLDSEGPMPFTAKAIDWSEYLEEEKDS